MPFNRGTQASQISKRRLAIQMLDAFQSGTRAAYANIQLFSNAVKCVRIRRGSDNVQQDFGFVNGVLDDAGIATFLGGASGYITKYYDQSGNGLDAVQATTSKQPLYEANSAGTIGSVKFDGTDDTMSAASVFDSSFNTKLASFEFSYKRGTSQRVSACGNGGGFYIGATGNSRNFNGIDGGISGTSLGGGNTAGISNNNLSSGVFDGTTKSIYVNDIRYQSASTSGGFTLSGPLEIGSLDDGGFYWDGTIHCQLLMNATLTDTQVRSINRTLIKRYSIEEKTYVLFDGNSLTAGVGSSTSNYAYPGNNYPAKVVDALGTSSVLNFDNTGGLGARIVDLISALTDTNYILLRGKAKRMVLVFWEGTNSIATGSTGASAYSDLVTYINKAKGYGFQLQNIYNLTCLVRGGVVDPQTLSGFETERLIYNQLMRDNVATIGAVIDVAAITQLQNFSNTTYFTDTIHLTDAGYQLIANMVAPLLNIS